MNARMPLAAIAVPALLAVTGLCAAMASSTEPARPVAAPQPSAQDAKPTAPPPANSGEAAPAPVQRPRVAPQAQPESPASNPAAAPARPVPAAQGSVPAAGPAAAPQDGAGAGGAGANGAGASGAGANGANGAGAPKTGPANGNGSAAPAGAPGANGSRPSSEERSVREAGVGTRRIGGDEKVKLVFNQTKVKELIAFIAEVTGKTVIPRLTAVSETPITVVSDREVTKREALDLIFQAFRINNIGVVENDRYVLIDLLSDVGKLQPFPVLGPEVDVFSLQEDGQFVYKVFRVVNTKAEPLAQKLGENMPDPTTITADVNSNQLIFVGDVATAKRVQRLLAILDVAAYVDVQTRTFRLQWADAQTIAQIIQDLFSARSTGGGGAGGAARAPQNAARGGNDARRQGAPNAGGGSGGELVGTSEQLLVTVLPATNSITIRAEPNVLRDIEHLITTAWDVNPAANGSFFRYYDLRYTDPLKVRNVLEALLESGGSGGSSARRSSGGSGRNSLPGAIGRSGGAGGESGADAAVANIFRIEAYPDSNRLVVISKTPDNFEWLDKMITELDKPLQVGLPVNIPLKHANAVEMAEILNALLAQAGSGAGITAPETGLGGVDFATAGGGGLNSAASGASSGGSSSSGGTQGRDAGSANQIQFPWQNGRGAGGEDATEVSAIVGKSRVVPNATQNSLLVLATPEIQEALVKIITDLDSPGRQVMITAILAEVQLGDQFAFGLQFGPAGLQPTNPNNAIVVNGAAAADGGSGAMYQGSREGDFVGDLTTSILAFGVDATVILQALDQVTTVRILQQPRVFTSDNKEAVFFDGQDIPFQTQQSNSGTAGGTTAAFEQISVGIGLNVRPRITKDRNVAMEIEVLLSNQNTTSPQGVGGNPVIDRRQTNTTVTIKNGQTIVISGIRREQRNYKKIKVPILGDIPGLDAIFAFTDDSTATKELVVFVTPIVVDNPDENDTNFNARDRERLRELAEPLQEKSRELWRQSGGQTDGGDPLGQVVTPKGVGPSFEGRPGAGGSSVTPPANPAKTGEPAAPKVAPASSPTPPPVSDDLSSPASGSPSQPVGGP